MVFNLVKLKVLKLEISVSIFKQFPMPTRNQEWVIDKKLGIMSTQSRKPFNCKLCPASFTYAMNFKRHLQREHASCIECVGLEGPCTHQDDRMLCDYCARRWESDIQLRKCLASHKEKVLFDN